MRTLILILLPTLLFGQELTLGSYLKRTWPSLATMTFAGGCNAVMDNVADTHNYRETVFQDRWPVNDFKHGQYIGPKDATWVNKWAVDTRTGKVVVGYDRYFLSSTALVGGTDLWHGAQSGMLLGVKTSILLYQKPENKWHYLLDFMSHSIAWSFGFHATQLAIKKR